MKSNKIHNDVVNQLGGFANHLYQLTITIQILPTLT